MVACICGGVGEITIIAGLGAFATGCVHKLRKKRKAKKEKNDEK